MDEGDFETVFLTTVVTLCAALRYLMEARPVEWEEEPPPADEKPEDVKPEKVVAIGGKKA